MDRASILNLLRSLFSEAIRSVTGPAAAAVDPLVKVSGDAKFGDYQCNVAMSLGKSLGAKPREIAERIAAAAPLLAQISEPLEIAGPGFLNVRLRRDFLESRLAAIPAPPTDLASDRLGIAPAPARETVVIDYSSPNIAKQMHVGHLRSTIIGDALARVLAFVGDNVVRQNHVGDWGTQFGMVILALWHLCMSRHRGDATYVRRMLARINDAALAPDALADAVRTIHAQHKLDLAADGALSVIFKPWLERDVRSVSLEELEEGYRFVTAVEKAAAPLGLMIEIPDPEPSDPREVPYHRLSRHVTAMLQRGHARDEPERQAWKHSVAITLEYCDAIYQQLGVQLVREDVRGESFYNDRLAPVVKLLEAALPAGDGAPRTAPWCEFRVDQGAKCVYCYKPGGEPLFKNPDGQALPLIVQKSDGAYLYATTDLAAVRFRTAAAPAGLGARRVLYVVGAPTRLHLEMVYTTARLAGWIDDGTRLEHVSFGQVLGEDRKLLRTRTGGAVKLSELLDEAERRALEMLEKKLAEEPPGERPSFSQDEKRELARRIGVGAVKYFDLARERNGDYVFSYDQMLAMQGNTAPYLMYAYARIRSIYRKAAERLGGGDAAARVYAAPLRLEHPSERALALRVLRLAETLDAVALDLTPHVLCTYAYELSGEFMRFYEACPVLQAPDDATRLSRLRLADLAARALRLALRLVGIEVSERM